MSKPKAELVVGPVMVSKVPLPKRPIRAKSLVEQTLERTGEYLARCNQGVADFLKRCAEIGAVPAKDGRALDSVRYITAVQHAPDASAEHSAIPAPPRAQPGQDEMNLPHPSTKPKRNDNAPYDIDKASKRGNVPPSFVQGLKLEHRVCVEKGCTNSFSTAEPLRLRCHEHGYRR